MRARVSPEVCGDDSRVVARPYRIAVGRCAAAAAVYGTT